MIRFHVSLFILDLFHTACCCLNFRTAPPLSLKRTWLDCLSLETVFIFAFSVYFLPKTTFFLTVICLCVLKSSKFDCEINFRNFRQLMCDSLYLQARLFLSVVRAVKSTRRKGTHKFVFSLSHGEIWCFIAINPLNNLKF